jgi:hypothetical protein
MDSCSRKWCASAAERTAARSADRTATDLAGTDRAEDRATERAAAVRADAACTDGDPMDYPWTVADTRGAGPPSSPLVPPWPRAAPVAMDTPQCDLGTTRRWRPQAFAFAPCLE